MKKQNIKVYCHYKDCTNFIIIEWDGNFIPMYICNIHKEIQYEKT